MIHRPLANVVVAAHGVLRKSISTSGTIRLKLALVMVWPTKNNLSPQLNAPLGGLKTALNQMVVPAAMPVPLKFESMVVALVHGASVKVVCAAAPEGAPFAVTSSVAPASSSS